MSFGRFSPYVFSFYSLDENMPVEQEQEKYYTRWMKKYSTIFKTEDNFVAIEWDLRCRKALREIFSSATFYVEGKKNLEMGCFSSYYFCLYYSLFHAIKSVLFFDNNSSIPQLLDKTHSSTIDTFVGVFANSSKDILSKEIKQQFNDLKYRREYYSYVTPFNNIFNHTEDLSDLKETLIQCYQLCSFHSILVEISYKKHNKGVTKFQNECEIYEFNKLFDMLFSKIESTDRIILDTASKFLKNEYLEYGFRPEHIPLDLEHQFDEFHGYDNFERGLNEHALRITDIWAFLIQALNG